MPSLGGTLDIEIPSTWGASTGCSHESYLLLTGVSPLNLNTALFGANAGYLYTSGELLTSVISPSAPPSWPAIVSFGIPNAPSLIGFSVYQQILAHTSLSFPCGSGSYWVLSRGGHAVLGL